MYTAPVAAGCSLHTTEEPFDCAEALQNWHVAFGPLGGGSGGINRRLRRLLLRQILGFCVK